MVRTERINLVIRNVQKYEKLAASGGLDELALQYENYREAFAYPEFDDIS